MKDIKKENIILFIQIAILLVTFYFVFVPFFKSAHTHLEIQLPRIVFFTIQTNILACCWFLYLIIRRFFSRLPVIHQGISLAMTIYVTITGVVYWAILVPMLGGMSSLFSLSNIWLHTVTPIVGIYYFIHNSKRAPIRKYHIALSMIYPALYFILAFRVNKTHGKFPYPFLSADSMGGTAGVAITCILILGLSIIIGWVFQKAYDRHLAKL